MDVTPIDHEKESKVLVATTFERESHQGDPKEETTLEQQNVKPIDANSIPVVVCPVKRKVKSSTESCKAKKAKCIPDEGFCLYVGHLNKSNTLDEIKDALASFFMSHSVLTEDIKLHPSRTFGYVRFVSEEDLKKALQLNKSMVLNQPLRLAKPTKKPEDNKVLTRSKRKANKSTRTLFVNNLSYKIKEMVLKKVFPTAVNVNIPQNNGKSRGFAFVEFSSVHDAQSAMKVSQDTVLAKRKIRLELCPTKPHTDVENDILNTLIITGLSEETSEETLQNAFEGAVSARIIKDKDTGVLMGYGFVDFETPEDCKITKEAMEDCEIDGKSVKIDYAKAKKKGTECLARAVRGKPSGRNQGHRKK